MWGFAGTRAQPSLVTLGDRARDKGDWDVAVALYSGALARDLRNAPLWVQYGHALKESGKLQDPAKLAQAEAAYRRALIYAPRVADTHLQLGHVLKLRGRIDEAKAAYLRALALDPAFAAARDELRALGWEEGDGTELQAALASLDGVAVPRRRRPSLIEQADAARDATQWALAARCYRAVLDRDPGNAAIWVQYGHALKEAGNLQDPARLAAAEAAYRRALTLKPGIADTHLQFGHVLKLQGRAEEAEAAYIRALALDPSMPLPLQELSGLGWSEAQTSELRGMLSTDMAGPLAINPLAHYLAWGAPNGCAPSPAGDGALVEAKLQLRERASTELNAFLEEGHLLRLPAAVEPAVSILLVLYNQAELTFRCLRALIETVDLPAEVIIIDNASSDSTWRLLDRLDGARIVRNNENLHFLRAVNQGAAEARGAALLLLNNDTNLMPGALKAAVETLDSAADIGAVGAKLILPDGTLQEAGSIIWNDGTCVGYGRGEDPNAPQYQFRREVDYCSAAFLLVRRALFEKLGGLDTVFAPAYYEETDFCMRLRQAGYRIVYDPRVEVMHLEFGSSSSSEQALALMQRNHKLFFERHRQVLEANHLPQNTSALTGRTSDRRRPRLLLIDDRVPFPSYGAGYPRASRVLKTLHEAGYFITYYPLVDPEGVWSEVYSAFPREIEFMLDFGPGAFDQFLETCAGYYDVIFVSRAHNMSLFMEHHDRHPERYRETEIVYDAEAVVTPRDAREAELAGKPLSAAEKEMRLRSELDLARVAHAVIAVSAHEAEFFKAAGIQNVHIMGHSLEPEPIEADFADRKDFLFVGTLSGGPPNVDALFWFVREVMPLLDALLGTQYSVRIVGRGGPNLLRELVSPRVEILGQIDDLTEFYRMARVFIAPTRFAAGLPHKIHEAASRGLPAVATSLLATQLGWGDDVEILVADTPKGFACQCARLYSDRALWQRIRNAGLTRVATDCSPAGFSGQLAAVLHSLSRVRNKVFFSGRAQPPGLALAEAVGPREEAVVDSVELKHASLISQSGLFDAAWYVSKYNDVKTAGVSPLIHYLRYGANKGYDPHRLFDSDWYLNTYPDVAESKLNPLVHYLRFGAAEGRASHPPIPDTEPLVPDFFRLQGMNPRGRIAVVLHLFDPDLWNEMRGAIERILHPFDLFVSLVRGYSDHMKELIIKAFPNAFVFDFENRGRDIGPFLTFLQSGVLFQYDLVCKLHSKRSPHLRGRGWRYPDGEAWRRALIDGILGSSRLVDQIISRFRSDPDLGIVVADGNIYRGHEHWVTTEKLLSQLLPRIGISTDVKHQSFPGGSIFWIRSFLLRTLASVQINFTDFEPEPLDIDGGLSHAVERMFGLICEDAGMRVLEHGQLWEVTYEPPRKSSSVRVVAFYLPQFHPIPENDTWWGEGFTEWDNVVRAEPMFATHRQPRRPSKLGFYDLRIPELREAQAELAHKYGVEAFCYYYYWFNGRRMLERPLDEVLASGKPDFPFLLCWANEPWTRNWDGLSQDILLPQVYELDWVKRFASDIAPALRDRRYFHLDGKPMLLIYRIGHIPDPRAAVQRLRVALLEEGLPEVHLAAGWVSFAADSKLPRDPAALDLDAYFEFPPHMLSCPLVQPLPPDLSERFTGIISDYNRAATGALAKLNDQIEGRRHKCVMAAWDNSARKGTRAHIFHGATPTNFRRWLRGAVAHEGQQGGERVVFVNAWNEWAEGAYLEPDGDFGCGWLEAVASATGTKWSETEATASSSDCERFRDRRVMLSTTRVAEAGDCNPICSKVRRSRDLCAAGNTETDQPQALPYHKGYSNWVRLYDVLDAEDHRAIQNEIANFSTRPRFLLLLEVGTTGEGALRRTLDSITSQLYPDWQLSLSGMQRSAVSALLATTAAADPRVRVGRVASDGLQADRFLARVGAGDVLAPHALFLLAATVIESPEADLIYSDEDRLDDEGRRYAPHFKTNWSLELVLGGEPVGRLCAIRSNLIGSVDELSGGDAADEYDWVLRLTKRIAPTRIRHIPHVLYHRAAYSPEPAPTAVREAVTRYLAACEIAAEVFPAGQAGRFNRVRYPLPAPLPRVSLIVPTRDEVGLLRQCIDGLLNATDYPNLEVLIVDNGSREPETRSYLASVAVRPRVKAVTYDRPFNFSAINNFAVKLSDGEFIGLVNNDIKVIRDDWLKEMVAQAARPGVGVVGAKLYYENDTIQHAGLVTGVHAIAGHVYRGLSRHDGGYLGRLHVVQEMSCVTGACMIIPRAVYLQVGGMDDVNLPVAYNDIDLCLRIRKLGYRVLWSPFAELYHLESASRGSDSLPEHRDRALREFSYMRARWGDELDHDPFYNPNLTCETEDFELSFPPRAAKPWRNGPVRSTFGR